MDCQELQELLDAYALGAADRAEARGLEAHVADCVRCWEELNEAQRTVALLALGVPLEKAPARLRERILTQAQREGRGLSPFSSLRRFVERRWPVAAAAALGAAAVAALALTAVLQVETNDLREKNNRLEREVENLARLLEQQWQLMALFAAPDVQELRMEAVSPGVEAVGVYYWSKARGKGFLVCDNLPPLREGQVYQVWFLKGEEAVSAGTFRSWNGIGELAIDLDILDGPPEAIGLSIEEGGGSDRPRGKMLLFASMSPQ